MTKSDIRHLCFKLAAQQQRPDSGVEPVIFDAEQIYAMDNHWHEANPGSSYWSLIITWCVISIA